MNGGKRLLLLLSATVLPFLMGQSQPSCSQEPEAAPASVCGNGVTEWGSPIDAYSPGETCDDGDTSDGDGCDHTCHVEPDNAVPAYVGESPYFATVADGQALPDSVCGTEDTWDSVVDVTTDAEATAVKNLTGKHVINVYWKSDGYPVMDVRNMTCVHIIGVPDASGSGDCMDDNGAGKCPLVTFIQDTHSYRAGGIDAIVDGGLIVENLQISPGLIYQTDPTKAGNREEGIGWPSSQRFVIVRNTEISRTAHHSIITGHSHHQYVELDHVHFFQAQSHDVYIDHIGMAYVHDSIFESPGNGHALRCAALRCVINDVQASNIQIDGTQLPNGGDNPYNPTLVYQGLQPIDTYVCGITEVNDSTMLYKGTAGGLFASSYRSRHDLHSCDVGEVSGGEWTLLEAYSSEYQTESRWATVTDLTSTWTNVAITCQGFSCVGFDLDFTWPVMNSDETTNWRIWVLSQSFADWSDFLAKTAAAYEPWNYAAQHALESYRAHLMGGTMITTPLEAPIPGWVQRATLTLNNVIITNGTLYNTPSTPSGDDYCFGPVPTGSPANTCTDQFSGAKYRWVTVVENP